MLRNVCKDSIVHQPSCRYGPGTARRSRGVVVDVSPSKIPTWFLRWKVRQIENHQNNHLQVSHVDFFEWWMETMHVYTISGWSKLVEKWESKSFKFKGEESWDDISFSWYQWNVIKADIWQTFWPNGTLKKQTSSTITVDALSFTKHDFEELKQYNNVPNLQKPQAKRSR